MSGNVPHQGETNAFRIVQALRDLFSGRTNAAGLCALASGVTSTEVAAPNCSIESHPILTPATAGAAAEYGAGTAYVSAVKNGSFVVTHSNSAADRQFHWVALG